MIKQILIPLTLVGSLFVNNSGAKAATVVLDDFTVVENPPVQFIINSSSSGLLTDLDESLDTNNVLGGSRFMELENMTNGLPFIDRSILVVSEFMSNLSWSNDNSVQSNATITWDANNAGLNANLSTQNAIEMIVQSVDLNVTITFTMTDGLGQSASLTKVANNPISPGDPAESFKFNFSDFMNIHNVDLTDIDAVQLKLDGPTAVDASFDLVQFTMPEIPEPSSILSILAVGAASFFFGRRYK